MREEGETHPEATAHGRDNPSNHVVHAVLVTDMLEASELIRQQSGWEWTIVRAPTLRDIPPVGYRLCEISEITSAHSLSREDYAACLLDSLEKPEHHRRTLALVPADST